MAEWLEGRHGSYRLHLGHGALDCCISWSSTRNDSYPYRVRIFGEDVGGAKTLEAAKTNTEKLAASILEKALEKLRG